MKLDTYLRFFWAGLLKQEQTGAIVPSQRFLVDKMIEPIPTGYTGRVVELGAGTGALTTRLAQRCRSARVMAIEINPTLARALRGNLDHAGINGQVEVVRDSAESVLTRLKRSQNRPDYIISGIPLGNVPRDETFALIRQIEEALAPGGMYIQFQYLLVDRKKVQASFPALRTVPVLLNFPPAFIYYARKGAAVPFHRPGRSASHITHSAAPRL